MPKKKNTGKKTSFPFDFTTPDYLNVPTKSIEVEKPINGFDYLNALARIPEIKKDIELLNKEPDNKGKMLELVNKYWGIEFFSPKLLQNPNPMAFCKYKKYFHNSNAIHVFSNWEKEPLLGGRWEHDPLSKYRDGRHVILAVDVTKKKLSIINEFKKLLNRVEKDYQIPKDTTRDREVEKIWEIYDYKTKDKLCFLAIAKRMTGLNDNPAYSPKLDARLQMVKRAYHKAEEIINTVKREVAEAITKNAKRQKADNERKEMLNRMAEESRKKERTITVADRLLRRIPEKTKSK